MKKETLLNALNFGSVDSESEENLDKIYIQTKNFDEFVVPNTALLLGSKGAGKSAMYRLFSCYEPTARRMANHAVDNVYFVSGIGFKDISEMDDMQLLNNIESKNISSEAAWKIYITYKIVHGLYDSHEICCGEKCKRVLQKAHKIEDYRLMSVFSKLYEKVIGEVPKIKQIDFKEISIILGKSSKVSVYDLLAEVDDFLRKKDKTVWILLDKIDELFANNTEIRKECIEGLFCAYIDLIARFKNIKFKIFLRTDIWKTLSFVNKSHLTDKTTTITWTSEALKELLVKRAVVSSTIQKYICDTIMDGLNPSGIDMIHQLHETGVIQYSTGEVLSSTSTISIPRLFRNGLGIITMGRP